ncbi:DUF4240 domain-containing protein [Amycolatopsis sp. H20-H5]|uniref:DUF4240 domain-containing protein n=1 Tax=Amycolatopsis sp. H20-H5 TaxID=3046309 RepID=UPI002DC001C7|nr:DUF4240 domain-containing protein [Amycolatopsis sp. H20-H5]MEC3974050.1 DUF4240 domain-containing protein [Amycolatopsis sp. H20-H5]
MREQDFWQLIRRARRMARRHAVARDELRRRWRLTDSRETVIQLGRLLEELPLSRVVNFHRQLDRVHRRAHRWQLWTAIGLTRGGADNAEFHHATCWLILRGRRAFARTLRRPDSLAGLTLDEDDILDAGGISLLAREILEPVIAEEDDQIRRVLEQTLTDLLPPIGDPGPPTGDRIPEDLATLRARYPRLCARHLGNGPVPTLVITPRAWQRGDPPGAGQVRR